MFCLTSLPCYLDCIVRHDADYFDFVTYLTICVTSRDLKASATIPRAQGRNFQTRRSFRTHRTMNVALRNAADLASQTVDHSLWTPENPLCCSKLCSSGGRTGLWMPPGDWDRGAPLLWWQNARKRSHIFHTATPQIRVADWIHRHNRHPGTFSRGQYVVCCEMCSEVVLRALEIIRLAHMRAKTSRILIGVDKIHTDDSSSDTPTATGDESDDYFSIEDSPS